MAMVCGLALVVTSTFGQGSLTPAGAPAPTMKTLTQIEPRIPISSAGYTITNSGSYYLTTNLTTTSHGIIIRSDHVTLDLMGFALTGDRGTSDRGVWLDGATNATVSDVVVYNGIVYGFGYGVYCEYGNNSRFERLMVSSNYYHGIYLYGQSGVCNGNMIRNCVVKANGSNGMILYGWTAGQCNGNTVESCLIADNGDFGIRLSASSGSCEGNTIKHCVLTANVNRGISIDPANGNRVEDNHITGQGLWGILTSSCSNNFILRNTCVGYTANFNLSVNDTYGPIVTNSGALPSSGNAAHPWANFSR